MECPKCSNTIGFVYGTCAECGWNNQSRQWERIEVKVDDLPEEIQEYLVNKHEQNIKRRSLR